MAVRLLGFCGCVAAGLTFLGGYMHEVGYLTGAGIVMLFANVYALIRGE